MRLFIHFNFNLRLDHLSPLAVASRKNGHYSNSGFAKSKSGVPVRRVRSACRFPLPHIPATWLWSRRWGRARTRSGPASAPRSWGSRLSRRRRRGAPRGAPRTTPRSYPSSPAGEACRCILFSLCLGVSLRPLTFSRKPMLVTWRRRCTIYPRFRLFHFGDRLRTHFIYFDQGLAHSWRPTSWIYVGGHTCQQFHTKSPSP